MSEYEQMTNPQLDTLENTVRAWDMRGDYARAILLTIAQAREVIQLRQKLIENEARVERLKKALARLTGHTRSWSESQCPSEYQMYIDDCVSPIEQADKALSEPPSTALAEYLREKLEPVLHVMLEIQREMINTGQEIMDIGYSDGLWMKSDLRAAFEQALSTLKALKNL